MDNKNNPFSQAERMLSIRQKINKTKRNYHESGIGPMLGATVITLYNLADTGYIFILKKCKSNSY